MILCLLICYILEYPSRHRHDEILNPTPIPIDTTRELLGYDYNKHQWIYKDSEEPQTSKTYKPDSSEYELLRQMLERDLEPEK